MTGRKRRAPGASTQVQQPAEIHDHVYTQDAANMAADQYLSNWNDTSAAGDLNAPFGDPSLYGNMGYSGGMGATGQSSHNRIVSLDGMSDGDVGSQLVRRNPNQQLAARRTPWDGYNGSPGQQPGWETVDDDEELEQKALLAKKDALSKRKQIPPFVQKLSSFLDEKNNENLIRWSDDGNSFIVIDEDEFARTLIPELFKHNNYASFVRQLNMYGFHKKVGLSDNSMKASETKAKAPSEYYNKYFKRGRPELLWLIQKPKNPTAGPKRKRDDEKQGDSDEDRKYVQDSGGGATYPEDLAVRGNQDMTMIPRTEYNSLRTEVRHLQQQQKMISNVLGQIRRQNDQLYQQATAFQALHDRHENSINAILTFLATFYNRSLEGNTNGLNLADMFGPAIPSQQPHGNVVDVDDFPEKPMNKSPQMHRAKRPLALLPAPTQKDVLSPTGRAATVSPSVRPTPSPLGRPGNKQSVFKSPVPQSRSPSTYGPQSIRDGSAGSSLRPESTTPTGHSMGIPDNDEIMSAIQNANANSGQSTTQPPQFDFPAALESFQTQDGNVPLTQQQRNDVLSLMANNASAASPNSNLAHNTNNAMVNPQPPPMPNLDQIAATQAQLELLQKMSDEQNSRVQSLQERLQPLSPSGSIPGLTDNGYFGSGGLGEPGALDLDFDSLVQGDDYYSATHGNGINGGDINVPDLNYELPDAGDLPNTEGFGGTSGDAFNFDTSNDKLTVNDDGRIESVSSSATSPTATVEEVEDETRAKRSPKRRKK